MNAAPDFTSQAFYRDLPAGIARMRESGPLIRLHFPIIGRVWVTTTHELGGRVLKDSATFTMRKDGRLAGLQWWMPGLIRTIANTMLTQDEPDHTRLRSLVDEAFRRRAIVGMEPHILAMANDMAAHLFDEGAPADIVERYARQLPLAVICELLGLPSQDRPKFISWMSGFTRLSSAAGFLRMIPSLMAMRRYLARRFDAARRDGGDGLIAELTRIEQQGGTISRDELVSMVFLLLGAGSETTMHLISGAVFELIKSPERRDWLTADWSRANLAVEEFLRFVSSVQFSKPRFVRRDITLGGIDLKAGERIMVMLAAANFDPAAIEAPERLNLGRAPNRHMAFGTGIHFCLGHQLARIEAKCALQALLTRWPKLTLAIAEQDVRWQARPGMRALASLPVLPQPA